MEQYYIGINKSSDALINGLANIGASVVCRWLPKIEELNKKYDFYNGEWFLLSCSTDGSELMNVINFLFDESYFDEELEFEIVAIRN